MSEIQYIDEDEPDLAVRNKTTEQQIIHLTMKYVRTGKTETIDAVIKPGEEFLSQRVDSLRAPVKVTCTTEDDLTGEIDFSGFSCSLQVFVDDSEVRLKPMVV